MRLLLCLMLLVCGILSSLHAYADSPAMNKPKTGWANVPGGTVWLNPGDAYEHDTGLIRDNRGVKRYPTTPQSMPSRPAVAPAVPPASPYAPAPVYQPYYAPPVAPYVPAPQPYYAPQPYQPYYMPPVPPYDYGPYVPPCCPHLMPSYNYGRAPSTQGWGVREASPMDKPKTGDAPRLK
jgi:hypothetical protein